MPTKQYLAFLVLLLQPILSYGLVLPDRSQLSVNSAIQYLEDPKGDFTIEFVRNTNQQWTQQSSKAFNQGYSSSAWWLKLQLQNESENEVRRFLEVSYAVLDFVDVFVYSDDTQLAHYSMGDKLPFAQRAVEHRFFVVPLQWQAGETLDVYYRIETSTAVQAPLTLWERAAFETRENNTNIIQGLYFGAMLVIAVYNLLIYSVVWERSYLFYVMFVVSLPLFVASISGQAYHFLWPESVVWHDHTIPFFLSMAFGSSALFARRFLRVKTWSSTFNCILNGIAFAAFSCLIVSFFVSYKFSIYFLVPLGLLACVVEMMAGIISWRKGVPNARYYVIAWLMFLSGGVMLALNKLGVLPTNFITEYSIQLGSVLEAVLLSFAMAERINEERRLRYAAQDDALQVTRRLNEELEQRVQERTQELEKLNDQLHELSNTDQLTQLKNRRYMETMMEEEWSRCRRYKHDFSIMMMDVDFFKNVNDKYGHPAGDACLQQVAERIKSCIRWPCDQLARYGGEEFCLILPETSKAGAEVVAERIRHAVESDPIIADDQTFSVTLSIGVCVSDAQQGEVAEALKSADLALYQSKEQGRNRVTVYGDTELDNVAPFPASKSSLE